MASKAYQKIYTHLEAITKATVSLKAAGVSNDELATVAGRLAQVVKIKGDLITLQVFAGTEGIPTDAEVTFFGAPPTLKVSEQLSGRFFNAYGQPIDLLFANLGVDIVFTTKKFDDINFNLNRFFIIFIAN